MKITFVTEHYPPHLGGVENVFQRYAHGSAEHGCEVRVITSTSNGQTKPYFEDGVHVVPLASRSLAGHPVLPRRLLAPHIQWADLVHTTTYTAALAARPLCAHYGTPCLLTAHEVIGRRWFRLDLNILLAAALYAAERYIVTRPYDHWHAVSNATGRDLIAAGIDPDRITLIYHGIDETTWHPNVVPGDLASLLSVPANSRILLYTGRAGVTKGVFDLIEAVHKADPFLSPDIRIGLLIPDDPVGIHQRLIGHIVRRGLGERVILREAAPAPELPALRSAAYAGIVPSRTEGFGLSAAEWSCLNVPLITSTAGALPEVTGGRVIDFPPSNVAALSAALRAADRNEFTFRQRLRLTWPQAIAKLLRLYKQLART